MDAFTLISYLVDALNFAGVGQVSISHFPLAPETNVALGAMGLAVEVETAARS